MVPLCDDDDVDNDDGVYSAGFSGVENNFAKRACGFNINRVQTKTTISHNDNDVSCQLFLTSVIVTK